MVQEVRQIMLNKEELIHALEAHRRMTPNFLPQGKIAGFNPVDKGGIAIKVTGAPENAEPPGENLVVRDQKLMMPLIRYCIENNIDLPHEARKTLLVAENNVSICVEIDLDADYIGAAPMRLHAHLAATARMGTQ